MLNQENTHSLKKKEPIIGTKVSFEIKNNILSKLTSKKCKTMATPEQVFGIPYEYFIMFLAL
jgi:hypothetical protein